MTNTTNQALIAVIQNNRRLFYKIALKVCKREEIADDLIQQVICRLLDKEIDFPIKNDKKFIAQMIVHAHLNYRSVNKKYQYVSDFKTEAEVEEGAMLDAIMERNIGCSYQADLFYSLQLKEIRKAAKDLPPGQQKAITNALAGNEIGEELGTENVSSIPKYESLKTNKRMATAKLKRKFS